MSAAASTASAGATGSTGDLGQMKSLPRWFPYASLIAAIALGAGLAAVLGGFIIETAAFAVVIYVVGTTVASAVVEGRRRATDRFATTMVSAAFLIAMVPLVSLVYVVIERGLTRLDASFFTASLFNVVGAGGGAYHAIIGTLLITAATSIISIPIGVLSSIYLVEYGTGKLAKAITFLVDVMTGIPSIVAGLFAYAMFLLITNKAGYQSGFAGAVALSVLMIPVVVRSTQDVLQLVPRELREASYALGVSKWRTIVRIVLPTAIGGIVTGVTLAIARVTGETAPLLLTAGYTTVTNTNLFNGAMTNLPEFIYFQFTTPGVPPQAGINRAWSAALILIGIVMLLNLLARLFARIFRPKTH